MPQQEWETISTIRRRRFWESFLHQEEWWTVWIGGILVVLGILLWWAGTSIAVIVPQWPTWSDASSLIQGFTANTGKWIGLWIVFTILFSLAVHFQGGQIRSFALGFFVLFLLSTLISIFSTWKWASQYGLEAPLVALLLGLLIGNLIHIPAWLDTALRTELYVKTGIVLMGATLPFTLIIKAGAVAFVQATIIAVLTFIVIYFAATKWLGLDKPFAATLGAGGSICGVSASIAVGSAIKAKKEHVSISISLVVIYALIFIFLLPLLAKWLDLDPATAGAWIGTSEFADAAGITAASTFGEKALTTFTLMKVIGRDMFIGVWCFVLSIISLAFWERTSSGAKGKVAEIVTRFPKFILGFFITSVMATILLASLAADAQTAANTDIIAPIKAIRTWTFTFTFLSIGLTTRFRQLTAVGWKPALAFGVGALVNVIVGYWLSAVVFRSFWLHLQ